MKTRYQVMAAALTVLTAACSSDDQPNNSSRPETNNQVKVEMGTRAPLAMTTKSAIDMAEYNNWVGQQVAVWGLASDAAWTTTGACLFETRTKQYAVATVGEQAETVYPLVFDDTYYYPVDGKKPFDFLAYAPITGAAVLADDNLTVDFTLTGAEDVIAATALGTDLNGVKGYSGAYFREAGATQPALTFKHYLSRLKFEVFAGNDETTQEANAVSVTNIQVNGVQTAATLTMTTSATNLAGTGAADGIFTLLDRDGVTLTPAVATIVKNEQNTQGTRIGESLLMLPGQDTINMTVSLECNTAEGNVQRNDLPASFTIPGGMVQGTQYRVKLVVYGMTRVDATASIEPWTDGDEVDVPAFN